MRKDLDRLMQERKIAGVVVIAHDRYTPAMYYAIGQKVHHGIYFRGADGNAHLIHDPMERDQAAAAGCEHSSFAQHGYAQLVEKEGRPSLAMARLIADTCAQLGINGPIAYFGDMSAAVAYDVLDRVRELNPALTVDRSHPDILTIARTTKDADEVASIRHAAEGAVSAIQKLREYLSGLSRKGDELHANGSGPVTLGQLRRLLHEEFLAYGLEGGETIVSQGRDAGVPHNRGNDAAPLLPGVPLLVDIFPGEAGGGYFSDLTRTFSVGPPKPELQNLYDDVHAAHRLAMDSLEVGGACRSYQEKVCDLFEKRGHATLRTNDGAQEGYVHGLGHGVGLAVHEAPRLGGPPSNTQALEPGMVITVEPGLYYPSRGLGVRIEDLVLVRPDGAMENLTPAPYDLIVEPRG